MIFVVQIRVSIILCSVLKNAVRSHSESQYRVFQKFVPIVNCILRKAVSASLGKCKLIQVRNLFK